MLSLALLGCREAPDPAPGTEVAPTSTSTPSPLVFAGGRTPTNLLGISLDTTRRDRLGRFSGRADTTPFLDARLAEAFVLEDHRSCSNWTAPSVLCATTGASPLELDFWPGSGDPEVDASRNGLDTLARALGKAGYDTTLVTGNRVFSDDLDTAQGFDTQIVRDYEPAPVVADVARERAATLVADGGPWYLHLHFMDPHRPYCPPIEYRGDLDALPDIGVDVCLALDVGTDRYPDEDAAWQQALLDRVDVVYRGELRYFDDVLGGLWADLDAMGALDDTLIVFFTDHGEQHMERGVIDHGFRLHAEENRATAAFWSKDVEPVAWTGPTLHTDLAVTLFALYGLETPNDATGVPLGQAPTERARRLVAYSTVDYGPPQLAVVRGDRSLHYAWDGARSFHHLDADPGELVDVWADGDPELDALWEEMDVYVADVARTWRHLDAPTPP